MAIKRNQPCLCGSGLRFKNCCALIEKAASGHQLGSGEDYFRLGLIRRAEGRLAEAIRSFEMGLELDPDLDKTHYVLGKTYWETGEAEESILRLEKALELDPGLDDIHYLLAVSYWRLGRFEKAISCCKRALAVQPDRYSAHYLISVMHRYTLEDSHLVEMRQLWEQGGKARLQMIYLAFALGKACEDAGLHDEAFSYLEQGNRLKRQTIDCNLDNTLREFERIAEICDYSWPSGKTVSSNPGLPIFIVGMPRSGTSLVEQILASHPEVHGAGELDDLRWLALEQSGASAVDGIYEALAADNGALASRIGEEYLKRLRSHSAKARYITDKMPVNFMLVGLISRVLPEAMIINCLREPLDNCLSIYKTLFHGRNDYAYDLEGIGRYYQGYQRLMQYWRELFPGKILDLNYEDLIADQAGETRRLLEFCGLAWDEACLDFHRTSRKVATASGAQVRQPIYSSSIGLWRKYEKHLAPLKRALEIS